MVLSFSQNGIKQGGLPVNLRVKTVKQIVEEWRTNITTQWFIFVLFGTEYEGTGMNERPRRRRGREGVAVIWFISCYTKAQSEMRTTSLVQVFQN